jgi:multidrug resistance efflux pump
VNSGASDPVFVIGNLSTVWLTAFVRETDLSKVSVGQEIDFNVPGNVRERHNLFRQRSSCDRRAEAGSDL